MDAMANKGDLVKVSATVSRKMHQDVHAAACKAHSTVGALVVYGLKLAIRELQQKPRALSQLPTDGRKLRYAGKTKDATAAA